MSGPPWTTESEIAWLGTIGCATGQRNALVVKNLLANYIEDSSALEERKDAR